MTSENYTLQNTMAGIAIIGSGIASTITLINLFEHILENEPAKPLQIIIIEKYPELWKGIPYGSRSSVNGLTITTISDFFTDEAENKKFFNWFENNIDYFITEFEENGGDAAKIWMANNGVALKARNWNNIYLPRFVIGNYFQQRLLTLKILAEEQGLCSLTIVSGEVTEIKYYGDRYSITVVQGNKNATQVIADKVVLAIGSAPERKLTDAFDNNEQVNCIDRIYLPSMEENIAAISHKLALVAKEERNILIVGSNVWGSFYNVNTEKKEKCAKFV